MIPTYPNNLLRILGTKSSALHFTMDKSNSYFCHCLQVRFEISQYFPNISNFHEHFLHVQCTYKKFQKMPSGAKGKAGSSEAD